MSEKHNQHRGIISKSLIVTVAMFGFGYAMIPLYDMMCQAFGLNGQVQQVEETIVAKYEVDKSRTVTVRMDANNNSRLPWEFRSMQTSVSVHPGEMGQAVYYARNLSGSDVVGQARYSVNPPEAARYFKKIECFCFTQQKLKSGEGKEMPVQFVVDPGLPKNISNIVLSYTFMRADQYAQKD